MAEEKVFYFQDTREDAKTSDSFGITNPDVAKTWTRDYNNGEGPFKPVSEEEYQKNRRDLFEETDGVLSVQVEADQTKKNLEVIGADHMTVVDVVTVQEVANEGQYGGMSKTELQAELDARGVEYKKSGPESTNETYIRLLEQDDATDSADE